MCTVNEQVYGKIFWHTVHQLDKYCSINNVFQFMYVHVTYVLDILTLQCQYRVQTICSLYKGLTILNYVQYLKVSKVTLLSCYTYYTIYSKHFVIIARTTSLYTNLSTALLNSSAYLQAHMMYIPQSQISPASIHHQRKVAILNAL